MHVMVCARQPPSPRLLQAAQARLDALENDNDAGGEAFGIASDDEEFNLEDEEEEEGELGRQG